MSVRSKLLTKLPRVDRYEVFPETKLLSLDPDYSKWRWRLVSKNGEITATGHEPFASDHNAARACRTVARINRAGVLGVTMGVPIFVEVATDTWREVSPA